MKLLLLSSLHESGKTLSLLLPGEATCNQIHVRCNVERRVIKFMSDLRLVQELTFVLKVVHAMIFCFERGARTDFYSETGARIDFYELMLATNLSLQYLKTMAIVTNIY